MTYTANQMAREEIFAGEEDPGHEYFVERPKPCEICGGPTGLLGTLGNRKHFQCRNCGAEFSRKDLNPTLDSPDWTEP
jgi:hypothetical protein